VQFMVLSARRTEQFADADFDRVIPEETEQVRMLYVQGVVRQIWLRDDRPGACFLVEAADVDEARHVVDALPMASCGLSEFTVIPLSPYRGFGPR
jgi:muconolactone delta-isomerase